MVDEDGAAGRLQAPQEFNRVEAIELISQQLDKGPTDSNFEQETTVE